MYRRREFLKAVGAVGFSGALAGCGRTVSASDQTLVVAAYPSVDAIARAAIPAWKRIHPDLNIEVISRQITDHHTAMMTALATESYLPDVMAIEVSYLGRFSRGGGLENLAQPPFSIEAFKPEFVPYAFDQATTKTDSVVAAPSDVGPGTLLYRHDILQEAGSTIEDLQNSWENFVAVGIKIKRASGAYLVANASDVVNILIRTGVRSNQGLYFDENDQPLITTSRFVEGFTLAAQIRKASLDAQVRTWSTDWAQGIRNGKIATLMSGAWLVGHMSNWLAPQTRGLWRAAQLPQKTWAAYGGSFLALPKNITASKKRYAWDFVKLLSLNATRQLAAFKSEDAFPVLVNTYHAPFFDEPIPFLGGQRARRLWREAALNIRAVQVHSQDAFAAEVVNTALFKVLHEGKSIKASLAQAQRLLERRVGR